MKKSPDQLILLEQEISRLQGQARHLEKELDRRLDYFQDNYRGLAIKSFIPPFLARTSLAGGAIEMLLENKQVRDGVNKITRQLFDKIAEAVEFLTKKFGKKDDPVA